MKTLFTHFKVALSLLAFLILNQAIGQISITSLPYTPSAENFNSYDPNSATNATATLPGGWTFSCSGIAMYNGQTVSGTSAGGFWAYSPASSGDFDLGALRDNSTGNISYQVDYVNNTGGLITSLVISWDYEQFRFANNSGWTCAGTGALAGNAILPTKNLVGASTSSLNTMIITTVPSFTLSGLSIANGATFGIVWTTTDDSGADNGIGIDNFSMSANATPSISISTATISAANLFQNSQNNVIYRTDITVDVSPATLSSISFSTFGNYQSSDLSNLKLWYAEHSTFSASNATLLATLSTSLGPGTQLFNGLSQKFGLDTAYLFLTCDLSCSVVSNTLAVAALTSTNLQFATGTITATTSNATDAQTFIAPFVNAVSNRSVCPGKATGDILFVTGAANQVVNWANTNTTTGFASSGSGTIASITAPTVSSNETSLFTATVSSGACVGNTISFNITVKSGNQASTSWIGGVSADWTDSDNWSNCACGSVSSVTLSNASGNNYNPVLTENTQVHDITIENGASLFLLNSTTLVVTGNWVNNGQFEADLSTVELAGTSTQSISGASATTFYNLSLNNSSGAVINAMSDVRGTLQLNSGVLTTNGLLSLLADSLSSGKIGPIQSSADIIGSVRMEQYAPGGSTGWALLGAPTATGTTFTDWNDNFFITCPNCPDGYFNFTSVFSYDETAPGKMDSVIKYVGINAVTETIEPGKGYWVYFGNGSQTSTAMTFDVNGPVAKSSCLSCSGPVIIPLSHTSNNGLNDDGWNLISNPLPSPISWTALRNGNPNVENAIYAFNADLNGGAGASASYINGISSPTTGGIGDNIAMCQAFFVHATAPTTLVAGENVKSSSNPVLLKSNSALVARPLVRLHLLAPGYNDETVFYFEEGGTPSFQTDFDAYKLLSNPSTYPYLASLSDSILTAISGLPALPVNLSVPVKAISPFTSTYTFTSELENFPSNICIRLIDHFTGISTDLQTSSYTCTLYDTTSISRFSFKVYTTPLNVVTHVQQPSCSLPFGTIDASPLSSGPFNYEWKKDSSSVKSSSNVSGGDSLNSLSGGVYQVLIQSLGQCESFTQSFTVQSVVSTSAAFSANTLTTQLSTGAQVQFANTSQNAQFSVWDFGDQSGSWYVPSPSHNYQAAGTYTVMLVTQSSDNCKDTADVVIQVIDDVTGAQELNKEETLKLCNFSNGYYELRFAFVQSHNLELQLFDAKGSLLFSEKIEHISNGTFPLQLQQANAVYLLKVKCETTERCFKLLP